MPTNPEVQAAAAAAAEAVNPAAAEPAAPVASAKKPWYKRTSVWCGITLACAAVAGIAAWVIVGGDATAVAADATDAATDAV